MALRETTTFQNTISCGAVHRRCRFSRHAATRTCDCLPRPHGIEHGCPQVRMATDEGVPNPAGPVLALLRVPIKSFDGGDGAVPRWVWRG